MNDETNDFQLQPSAKNNKYLFFTSLNNLKLSVSDAKTVNLAQKMRITKNTRTIQKLLAEPIPNQIGQLHYKSILESSSLLYSESPDSMTIDPEEYFDRQIEIASTILAASWIVSDNAISMESCYLVIFLNNKINHVFYRHSSMGFVTASGTNKIVTFSRREFNSLNEFISPSLARGARDKRKTPTNSPTAFTKILTRYEICIQHIYRARLEEDIAIKIAFYCSALESLFSSTDGEISHQIAERVAIVLADSPAERVQIYKGIKKSYGTRSKHSHGGSFKKSEVDSLKLQSIFCDWAIRSIISRIFENDELATIFMGTKNSEEINNYLRDLVLGVHVLKGNCGTIPNY